MVEFKFVINDPKSGKTFQKAFEDESMLGKKLGEKISGDFLGLEAYELEIRGATDFAGFPLTRVINGPIRKRALLSKGFSMKKNKTKGVKIRKTVCGNIISRNVVQINLKVTKVGTQALDAIFAKKEEGEAKAE